MTDKSFDEMTLHEVFELEDELTCEIGSGNFSVIKELSAAGVPEPKQDVAIARTRSVEEAVDGSSHSESSARVANKIAHRLNWFQRLFEPKEGTSWVTTPAFAWVILLFLAVPTTFLLSGVFNSPITLEPAAGKSIGEDLRPKLELNFNDGIARFVAANGAFAGPLTSIPSAGPDVEVYWLAAVGKNSEGRSMSVLGTLRLIRVDALKPIRSAADIASGKFSGTIESAGKQSEKVEWIYQTPH